MKKLKLKNDPSAGMENWVIKWIPKIGESFEEHLSTRDDLDYALKDGKNWFSGKAYVYRIHYDFREGYRFD